MFTGIVQKIGIIKAINKSIEGANYVFYTSDMYFKGSNIGDSIAVNGVCLTAVEITDNKFVADVSKETLDCTTFSNFNIGDKVNLEKSLRLNQGIDGHLISGHIDGICVIENCYLEGASTRFEISTAKNLIKYIARKGSVCINGVSLTVNKIEKNIFSLNIVPHTLKATVLGSLKIGDKVNLEIDIIARYLEQLLNNK